MKLMSITGNSQKLDGGAMFGNAPKALWERFISPDSQNRIPLATRALLVQTGDRNILFEAGIGAFMSPKLKDRFGVTNDDHVLLDSLNKYQLQHTDITDIILSHMHFDHAGGLLSAWDDKEASSLLFPNATFYISQNAWERSQSPHPRDRASFLPDLIQLLDESKRVRCLTTEEKLHFKDLEVQFYHSDGHTPGMLCSDLRWKNERLIFAADLIPGTPWVHIPITMGYDRFPEKLIEEKQTLLSSVVSDNAWVFYTHDMEVSASKIEFNKEKQKYMPVKTVSHFQITV